MILKLFKTHAPHRHRVDGLFNVCIIVLFIPSGARGEVAAKTAHKLYLDVAKAKTHRKHTHNTREFYPRVN